MSGRKIFIHAVAICSIAAASAQNNFFPDGEHFSALRAEKIVKVDYFTNRVTDTLLDVKGAVTSHILSPDGTRALLVSDRNPIYRRSFTADYTVADFKTDKVSRVSDPCVPGMRDASFSPDGSLIAFVLTNNLYVTAPGSMRATQITQDGNAKHIINGVTDWVYEEEYGFTKAYEFSPDGRQIAFLRFDESRVPEFAMMRYDKELYPRPYLFKYPKAGKENSIVTLHVYDIASGETSRIDTGPETDQYIPRIGWTPSGELFFYRVNRLQNRFEVLLAGRNADGELNTRVIYEETSPHYVERPDETTVTFLPDGSRNADNGRFIVRNETHTGWMHLYLYSIEKGLLGAITSGEWEVTQLVGEKDGTVWYVSTEASPLERHLYSVKLNGKNKKRLTGQKGTYRISPTPGMKYYTSVFSDALHSGTEIEKVNTAKPELFVKERADLRPLENGPEFFSFPTAGVELNGYMFKPADFDPSKKYPVFMTQYSGPGSQNVADKPLLDNMTAGLLSAGYIVACVDGRGTGFRGEEFKKCTYGQLGKLETEDQISAAEYLGSLPCVDASRIGIYGWSYGGFMALNCILKGADVFKLAVAVAPVTNWRYYDSIYTEIYNGLPEDNPEGYDDNSPINFADLLKGKLLLIHGSGDDNVHVQNSYEMAKALVKAGKQFDFMIYPDDNHSMWPNGSANVRTKIVGYVIENL